MGQSDRPLVVQGMELINTMFRSFIDGGWTQEEMERHFGTPEAAKSARALITTPTTPVEERGMSTDKQMARWVKLYKLLGITLDPAEVKIPVRQPGMDRLIVLAQGLTIGRLLLFLNARGLKVLSGVSHPDADVTSIRTAKDGPYAIWCRNRVEADEENHLMSADQFPQALCLTVEEYTAYFLMYHFETGQYLDAKTRTICAGSRLRCGNVPHGRWSPANEAFYLSSYDSGCRRSGGVRSAVV